MPVTTDNPSNFTQVTTTGLSVGGQRVLLQASATLEADATKATLALDGVPEGSRIVDIAFAVNEVLNATTANNDTITIKSGTTTIATIGNAALRGAGNANNYGNPSGAAAFSRSANARAQLQDCGEITAELPAGAGRTTGEIVIYITFAAPLPVQRGD